MSIEQNETKSNIGGIETSSIVGKILTSNNDVAAFLNIGVSQDGTMNIMITTQQSFFSENDQCLKDLSDMLTSLNDKSLPIYQSFVENGGVSKTV